MLTNIVDGLIDILSFIANAILLLLPDTPFVFEPVDWGPFGDAVGIIFPIQQMGIHMTAILGGFALYYAIRWLLRIIRQVQ